MKVDLIGGTGASESTAVSSELTQNWYVHSEPNGKNNVCLYPTPGLSLFTITTSGPIRGMIEFGELLYVVSAAVLYEITSAGAVTSRGTLNTSSGRVSMAHNGHDNGNELLIVDGTDGWIFNSVAVSFTRMAIWDTWHGTGPDIPLEPTQCVYMDSYFIVNDPYTTGRFYVSNSYDGSNATGWEGLRFATAERDSDELQTIVVSNRILWFLGTKTAEAWLNNGDSTVPFEPIQTGFSEWGTPAPESAVEMGGSVFYLSQNSEGKGQVVMTNGLSPQVISTQAITTQIDKMTIIDDAYGYVYQHNGHSFYVLTFPTETTTLVYDVTTQLWHEWKSASTGYHRSTHHVFIFNQHMVGDPNSGKIFKLDWDEYTDYGDVITRIRRSKSIHAEDRAVRHRALWVDMEEGVGDFVTLDPQIMLRLKDDNGLWSNEKWRSIGALGKYNTRVIWRMLGRSRDRVYELKITDPVKAVIIAAYADVDADEEDVR